MAKITDRHGRGSGAQSCDNGGQMLIAAFSARPWIKSGAGFFRKNALKGGEPFIIAALLCEPLSSSAAATVLAQTNITVRAICRSVKQLTLTFESQWPGIDLRGVERLLDCLLNGTRRAGGLHHNHAGADARLCLVWVHDRCLRFLGHGCLVGPNRRTSSCCRAQLIRIQVAAGASADRPHFVWARPFARST